MNRRKPWEPPTAFNVVATLILLAAAVGLSWAAWTYYVYAPWTRDGRVRVRTVEITPRLSGVVEALAVADDQFVHRGDVLFRVDPAPPGHVGKTAPLAVRSPVNGWVTDLQLRPDGLITADRPAMTLVDADSFWIEADFEETKLRRIHVGDPVRAMLMAYPHTLVTGRIANLGHGVEVGDSGAGRQGLPVVDPVFAWVRLARRMPVRVELVDVPCPVVLVSGLTATVTVLSPNPGAAASVSAHQRRRIAPAAAVSCGTREVDAASPHLQP